MQIGFDPLVNNGVVFVPLALKEAVSGGLYAFDATTGATVWSVTTPYGIWSTPTMDPTGTNLYVDTGNPCLDSGSGNCSGYIADINPTTGAMNWQYHVADLSGDDDVPTTPTYSNAKIYAGSKNGIFYCLDATSGTLLFQYDTGKRGNSGIYSSPAISNGKAYFGGGDGRVHALNISDFSLAWSYKAKRNFIPSPAEANGIIYISGGDGNVYAFDATTGTKLWNYSLGVAIFSSVAISNGILYVSGSDGYFYAFSLGGV